MPLAAAQELPIWINGLIFAVAGAIIWAAGTWLVAQADAIARKTGMGQALAGMFMLGTITSLPEIANVTTASLMGNPELAINNLLGSASMNLVLLAAIDAFVGGDALTSVVTQPATMMQAVLCMMILALVAAAVTTGDLQVLGIGTWSLLICLAGIGSFWLAARYQRRPRWRPREQHGEEPATAGEEDRGDRDRHLTGRVMRLLLAGAIILVAGYSLSLTGDALADQTGLGSGLVGFVLIGFATSLPELSTLAAALRRRRHEMAIGEVLGTNFVNISLILLADLTFTGGAVINQLGSFEIVSSLLGVLLTGTLLIGLLERRNLTIFRMGYDSFCMLSIFAFGLILLYMVR